MGSTRGPRRDQAADNDNFGNAIANALLNQRNALRPPWAFRSGASQFSRCREPSRFKARRFSHQRMSSALAGAAIANAAARQRRDDVARDQTALMRVAERARYPAPTISATAR